MQIHKWGNHGTTGFKQPKRNPTKDKLNNLLNKLRAAQKEQARKA